MRRTIGDWISNYNCRCGHYFGKRIALSYSSAASDFLQALESNHIHERAENYAHSHSQSLCSTRKQFKCFGILLRNRAEQNALSPALRESKVLCPKTLATMPMLSFPRIKVPILEHAYWTLWTYPTSPLRHHSWSSVFAPAYYVLHELLVATNVIECQWCIYSNITHQNVCRTCWTSYQNLIRGCADKQPHYIDHLQIITA